MDYSGTMRRGWDITWRNKWLILLALIPLLVMVLTLPMSLAGRMIDPAAAPEEIVAAAGRSLLLSCVSLILYLVSMFLNLLAHSGRIAGVARVALGQATDFGRSVREGWRALPRLLGLSILLYGVPLVLFVVVMILILVPVTAAAMTGEQGQSAIMAGMGTVGIILLCCLYIALLLTFLFVALIFPFASRGIVLRNLGVMASLRHGWRVLRENLGQIILLALPFTLLYILFGLIFGGIYFAVAFPEGFQSAIMRGTGAARSAWLPLAYLVYLLPVTLLTTWQGATVTLGYLHWTGKDVLGAVAGTPDLPPAAPLM